MTKIELLNYLLEASINMAIFYLAYSMLLQRDTFFNQNRYYLLITSFASMIIPVMDFSQYPEIALPATYQEPLQIIPQSIQQVHRQFEEHLTLTDYLFYLYVSGVSIFLLLFVYKIIRLARFIKSKKKTRYKNHIVLSTEGHLPTFSFFTYLFWDNSQHFQAAEAEQVLQHELTHIKEKHSWDIVYIHLLQIMFWFNPFCYMYKNALQTQHEFLADRSVTQHFPKEPYKSLLAKTFLEKIRMPFSHSFNQGSIKNRIAMMNKKSSTKTGMLKLIIVLPLAAMLLFAFTSEAPKQTILPDSMAMPSDTIPKPSIVPFAVSNTYNGGYKQIDLQEGISVSQLPEAIQIRAIAEPSFAEKYPKEAQFRVSEFKINLIRGRRVYYTKSNKSDSPPISFDIKLDEVKNLIEAGDRLLIEVIEVLHMNSKGQISTIKMVPEKYMLNIAINE